MQQQQPGNSNDASVREQLQQTAGMLGLVLQQLLQLSQQVGQPHPPAALPQTAQPRPQQQLLLTVAGFQPRSADGPWPQLSPAQPAASQLPYLAQLAQLTEGRLAAAVRMAPIPDAACYQAPSGTGDRTVTLPAATQSVPDPTVPFAREDPPGAQLLLQEADELQSRLSPLPAAVDEGQHPQPARPAAAAAAAAAPGHSQAVIVVCWRRSGCMLVVRCPAAAASMCCQCKQPCCSSTGLRGCCCADRANPAPSMHAQLRWLVVSSKHLTWHMFGCASCCGTASRPPPAGGARGDPAAAAALLPHLRTRPSIPFGLRQLGFTQIFLSDWWRSKCFLRLTSFLRFTSGCTILPSLLHCMAAADSRQHTTSSAATVYSQTA